MDYRVRNDSNEEAWASEEDLDKAAKDGYLPVVSNGSEESRVEPKNFASAASDGYTPEAYIEQYGMSQATLAADEAGPQDPLDESAAIGAGQAFLGGTAEGVSAGFADEIGAGASTLGSDFLDVIRRTPALQETFGMDEPEPAVPVQRDEFGRVSNPDELGDGGYVDERDAIREGFGALEEAQPGPYLGGQVLGGIASSAVLPGAASKNLGTIMTKGVAEGAAAGAGLSEEESLAGIVEDAALAGTFGGVTAGGGTQLGKLGGAAFSGKTVSKLRDSAAEKAKGLRLTKSGRDDISNLMSSGKLEEGEAGRFAREEGLLGWFGNKSDQIHAKKQETGEQIAAMLEEANPIKAGKVIRDLEEDMAAFAIDTDAYKHMKEAKNFYRTGLRGEKGNIKNLEKFRDTLDRRVMRMETELEGGAAADPESLQRAIQSLKLRLDDTNKSIDTVSQSATHAKHKARELRGKIGASADEDLSGAKEGMLKQYENLNAKIADSVDDKEKWEALNKRNDILDLLKQGAGAKAEQRTNQLVGQSQVATGRLDKKLLIDGYVKYGHAFAHTGLSVAQFSNNIPKGAAKVLLEAAKRGGSAAVMASHDTLLKKDQKYREAIMKQQESKGE